jgi:orotate phosphoribosyltransferase
MTTSASGTALAGGSVAAGLGIRVSVTPARPDAVSFADAVEVGLRRNPRRAQLLVSRVLGKHIPVPAGTVLAAAHLLGAQVRAACGGRTPVVVGFAETATGLGHAVAAVCAADGGPAPYLHTSRRPAPAAARVVRFSEEHSHATDQALALLDDSDLSDGAPLVLVDDELTTGTTAVNAIRAIQSAWPRQDYVLASLIDCRSPDRRAEVTRAVRALGANAVSVRLLDGEVELAGDHLERAHAFIGALPEPEVMSGSGAAPVSWLDITLPAGVPTTAVHRWGRDQEQAAATAMARVAATLPVARDRRTLVLGDEEHMYLPQLLARALGEQVRTSTTTRTPAVVCDRPGYPLRTMLAFGATRDSQRPAYAYNVAPSACDEPGNAPGFDDVVLVTDAPERDRVVGLASLLAQSARNGLHVITLRPAGEHAAK